MLGNVRKTDLVARWGGDRFMVWLPGMLATVAGATAEKLRVAIAQIPVPSTLADGALQHAKQGIRGCVVVARPGA